MLMHVIGMLAFVEVTIKKEKEKKLRKKK